MASYSSKVSFKVSSFEYCEIFQNSHYLEDLRPAISVEIGSEPTKKIY